MSDIIYPPGSAATPNDDLIYPPGALIQAFPGAALLSWPAASGAIVNNGTYELALSWPWLSGQILSLTGSTSRGSFTASVQAGGLAISGGALAISTLAPVSITPAANLLTQGVNLTLAISGATGSPTDASVQVTYSRSNP